MAYQLTHS